MQLRQLLATTAGGGLLIAAGLSVALAGPASAASPTPLPTTPSLSTATPAAPTSAPTSAATGAPSGIEVPAGNAGTTKSDDGLPGVDVGLLFGAGLALAGGGALTVVRRRG